MVIYSVWCQGGNTILQHESWNVCFDDYLSSYRTSGITDMISDWENFILEMNNPQAWAAFDEFKRLAREFQEYILHFIQNPWTKLNTNKWKSRSMCNEPCLPIFHFTSASLKQVLQWGPYTEMFTWKFIDTALNSQDSRCPRNATRDFSHCLLSTQTYYSCLCFLSSSKCVKYFIYKWDRKSTRLNSSHL